MKIPARRISDRMDSVFLAAACGLFLLFAGCRADQRAARKAAGEVIVNCGGNVKTLDPGKITDVTSGRGMLPFLRGLTILDGKGTPHPELAESWTVSPDGKTYDFKLRATKWTNGEPVTAGDYAYAWLDRNLNPKFNSEYAYMLFYVEGAKDFYEGKITDRSKVGIEVVAPDRLRVRLAAPAPFFPQLVAHQSYYPVCKSVDQANPDWALRAETYVGNGPFRMTVFTPGDKLVGIRQEGYWNAASVAMKQIAFRFIDEESTERIAFENREIDASYTAPRADLEQLAATGALRQDPLVGTYFINFNMRLPIFSDVRVRRALTLAVDRAAITKNVSRAGEKPAMSLVPPELYGGEAKPYFADAQFVEAKKLPAEAG
ncbi:peptide ABC transporter substrate-binding protein, partial [Candidatus Sumerlaeota bacterium]|nr:peptide ABC transporter substrate-binding protein [Candidatus Sumerlaeota bacterium]